MSRVGFFAEHCQKLNDVPKSPVLLGLKNYILMLSLVKN